MIYVLTLIPCNHRSPARITETYIQDFEALGGAGQLYVLVQNIGTVSADYSVSTHVLICCYKLYIYIYTLLLGQPRQIISHNSCITIIRGTLASYYSYTMQYPANNSVNAKKPRARVYNYNIYTSVYLRITYIGTYIQQMHICV